MREQEAAQLAYALRELLVVGYRVEQRGPTTWQIDGSHYSGDILRAVIAWGDDTFRTRDDWP